LRLSLFLSREETSNGGARTIFRADKSEGGNYFAHPKTKLKFIPSGCKLLDLALGGGWARGRVANIVGDKSTGKTLLCIEAAPTSHRRSLRARYAIARPKRLSIRATR
jgi:predicted ATP-dependent serine protease